MATLLAAIEATLLGKDERLVAKCNVPGILAVFERWDIYDDAFTWCEPLLSVRFHEPGP